MEPSASAPIKLSQGESVLFLSPDRDDEIARNVRDIFRQDYGADTIPMLFMQAKGTGQEGYDILTDEGSCKVSEKISSLASLAGMVITLPKGWSRKLKGIADVSRLLRGLFLPLKAFLQLPAKKFVVLIHSERMPKLSVGCWQRECSECSSAQRRNIHRSSFAHWKSTVLPTFALPYAALWTEDTPRLR